MKKFKRDSMYSSRKPQHVEPSSYPLNHKRVIVRMFRSGQGAWKLIPCPRPEDKFHPWVKDIQVWWAGLHIPVLTWFFPFSISKLVTFPKGSPSPITSASFMSLGSLRTWTTRDGTPGLRTSPLNFLVSLPLAARKKTEVDTIREGTEGSGSSWIMDWSSWQHKHRHDKHFNKKGFTPPWQPPTWVHDIGPVGYAGRKEFVGSPLQKEKKKQWFTSVHSPMRAQHGRWRAQLSYYEPLCDMAGSNLITKRRLSKHAWEELHLPHQEELSDLACQQIYFTSHHNHVFPFHFILLFPSSIV